MEHDPHRDERPRVEVIWHRDFASGEVFAKQIYECVGISLEQPLENKPGLRTRFWTDIDGLSLSEVVPGGGDASPATVIVLIDDHLLGNKRWEGWLMELSLRAQTDHETLRFIPIVASGQRQANVQLLGQMNFIDVGVDADGQIADDCHVLNQILISILQFIDRSRLYYDIFMSYVREDGIRLRDKVLKGLARYAYLRPFVDEWDLVAGAPYRERFQTVIQSSVS